MNPVIHRIRNAQQSVNWGGRAIKLALALSLVLALFAASAPGSRAARLQPLLVEMAAQQPDQTIGVIVQKSVKDDRVEQAVAALGGTVTKDLHIINAFAAEMTAKDAARLAKIAGVRWVSLDAPMREAGGPDGTVSTKNLLNAYNFAVNADKLWAEGYQGSSVTVAVLDSGLNSSQDFKSRILTKVKTNSYPATTGDNFGHGTHIAGIIGGDGRNSAGKYVGIAPKVKLVSVKVSDDQGQALTSDVVSGLQWILENQARYNIRVVSISLNSSVAEPYHTSAVDAACEILWFNGLVVVVSAGNNGTATLYPPANDPFVITVGATDDKGTTNLADDTVTTFSAYGTTESGFAKPDLVAPGKNIISTLSSGGSVLPTAHPANTLNSNYFKMSGTSMSAPMVSGAVALLLQDEPDLNPDQVKYRLMATANQTWSGYSAATAGAGYLDAYAAVKGTTTQTANTGLAASQLLWTGTAPVNWGSVQWGSVQWGSVQWGSVQWGSVQWGSVQWGSDYWGP